MRMQRVIPQQTRQLEGNTSVIEQQPSKINYSICFHQNEQTKNSIIAQSKDLNYSVCFQQNEQTKNSIIAQSKDLNYFVCFYQNEQTKFLIIAQRKDTCTHDEKCSIINHNLLDKNTILIFFHFMVNFYFYFVIRTHFYWIVTELITCFHICSFLPLYIQLSHNIFTTVKKCAFVQFMSFKTKKMSCTNKEKIEYYE